MSCCYVCFSGFDFSGFDFENCEFQSRNVNLMKNDEGHVSVY